MYTKKSIFYQFIFFTAFIWLSALWPMHVFAVTANDTLINEQYYLTQIDAENAWQEITGSREVVIAVIDTGVDIDHPDLKENIWVNYEEIPDDGIDNDNNGYIDDVNGWDFITKTPDPRPKIEKDFTLVASIHGTLVAGIVGAVGNNNKGTAGINWHVSIMSLRVLNHIGSGESKEVIEAIDYAIKNGADIINLSFVGIAYDQKFADKIKDAHNAGLAIVAAAGNEGGELVISDLDFTPHFPVCYDGTDGVNRVIGVAGVDIDDMKAAYSNYGVQCIDISAPGTHIFTTQYFQPAIEGLRKYYNGKWSGTSLSAPMVSGALGLMKAKRPDMSMSELSEVLIANADDINFKNLFYLGELGSGRLNIAEAINALDPIAPDNNGQKELNDALIYTLQQSGNVSRISGRIKSGEEVTSFDLPANLQNPSWAITDIDNDGALEAVVGNGEDQLPVVSIYNVLTGELERSFEAFPSQFTGGVSLAIGDLDNNGAKEIITAPQSRGGPQIRIFDNIGNLKGQFFADDKTLVSGYNVSVADSNGDGKEEIVFSQNRSNSTVKIFDFRGVLVNSFVAIHPAYGEGINLAAGDINGDNRAEIIVSSRTDNEPLVKIFDINGAEQKEFFAYSRYFRGGVNLGLGDINQDGRFDIITGAGSGGGPHVRIFNYEAELLGQFFAGSENFQGGVTVAGTQ